MTQEQALEKAREAICFLNLGDIEYECQRRGIKLTKKRSLMEQKLIKALTKEHLSK
ncbi:MAG: hypothetical protein GX163_11380 [Bacteroidetes bacterium]|jgi:hypothetical protein|nr:hypothetical protein [Bacteroidota bacterium]